MNLNLGDIYAILTAFCWSFAVILFDISSRKLNSLQMSVIKNFIGVFGFILTIFIMGIPIPDLSWSQLSTLFISGFIGVGIADLLFLGSLRRLGSGLSAIVATMYSPAIFLFSYLMFGESISIQSYLGGLLVILGIAISTFKVPLTKDKKTIIQGVLFGIIAQILTAYSVLLVKPIMADNSVIIIALYRFSIGFIFTVFCLGYKYGQIKVFSTFKSGLKNISIILGAFMGTYLSVIFWLAGFKYTISGRAAIYNQLSTVIIIIMAFLFLKEPMTKKKYLGVILSITGALIVSSS
ncbi:DMT family transporter [Candidatus Marinimicrobia bacterium]|jgi:DME family drug/metabolite transporter|nr:DMT family transporter [Candidatus Neomarinimicrobiota bacterium]|tara:strand:+ start:1563 stop:2444 length:882 start_codon:yes stop_codon:yes gene_type:complete